MRYILVRKTLLGLSRGCHRFAALGSSIAGKVANAEQVVFGKISLRASRKHWYDCCYVQLLSLSAGTLFVVDKTNAERRSHLLPGMIPPYHTQPKRFTVHILAESGSAAGQRSETNRSSYWQKGRLCTNRFGVRRMYMPVY